MQDQKTLYFLQKVKDSGNWNDNYDYSKVEYVKSNVKIIIIDKFFNTEHLIIPTQILRNGRGKNICCGQNLRNGYLSFDKARAEVLLLSLGGQKEWSEYSKNKRPHYIPSNPQIIYKNKGWKSWGDWLGNENVSAINISKSFLNYDDAIIIIHKLKLNGQKEWVKYCKSGERPDFIPSSPQKTYKNKGWKNWNEWLGNKKLNIHNILYLPFNDAKILAKSLKFNNVKEWIKWAKTKERPKNVPSSPNIKYKNKGWISWSDFLGSKNKSNNKKHNEMMSFEEAKEFVKKLGIKSISEWEDYCKSGNKPDNLPFNPRKTYGY